MQNFHRVVLDPQIENASRRNSDSSVMGQLSMNYYPSLIDGAEFVVGGLSSFILEATLRKKYVLVLSHRERFNPTSPKRVLNSYEHFNELGKLRNLRFCGDTQDLRGQFRELFLQRNLTPDIDEIGFFVNSKVDGYVDRLRSAIEAVCKPY